jgi:hypothetical protein
VGNGRKGGHCFYKMRLRFTRGSARAPWHGTPPGRNVSASHVSEDSTRDNLQSLKVRILTPFVTASSRSGDPGPPYRRFQGSLDLVNLFSILGSKNLSGFISCQVAI